MAAVIENPQSGRSSVRQPARWLSRCSDTKICCHQGQPFIALPMVAAWYRRPQQEDNESMEDYWSSHCLHGTAALHHEWSQVFRYYILVHNSLHLFVSMLISATRRFRESKSQIQSRRSWRPLYQFHSLSVRLARHSGPRVLKKPHGLSRISWLPLVSHVL